MGGKEDKSKKLPQLVAAAQIPPTTTQHIMIQEIPIQNRKKSRAVVPAEARSHTKSTPPESTQTSFYLAKDKIQSLPAAKFRGQNSPKAAAGQQMVTTVGYSLPLDGSSLEDSLSNAVQA